MAVLNAKVLLKRHFNNWKCEIWQWVCDVWVVYVCVCCRARSLKLYTPVPSQTL